MAKDAWWLMKRQLSFSKIGFVVTILFYAAYGAMSGMFANDWLSDRDAFTAVLIDIVVVIFLSMNGFVFCKGYFNNPYWKTDAFTKKLATMRTLPIPAETLAMSRSLQVLLMSPISTIAFFLAFYLVSDWARALPLSTYLQFVLVWYAFGNAGSVWFVVEEWSRSGLRYLLSSLYAVFAFFAAGAAITLLTGSHLTFGLAEAIRRPGGWLWTALAVAVAVGAHVWMRFRLRRVLLRRDFA